MIYEIKHPDPMVYQQIEPFDFSNPPIDPVVLVHDLAEAMLRGNGIGLAANQAGLPYRVFLIKSEHIIACFNPKIVNVSDETIVLEEGCLSFPGLIVKVKRPLSAKIRYTEPNGNVVTTQWDGMTARIAQHEIDHLDGRTMLDAATFMERDRAKKKWKQLKRQGAK
jgi:peptide deformylase